MRVSALLVAPSAVGRGGGKAVLCGRVSPGGSVTLLAGSSAALDLWRAPCPPASATPFPSQPSWRAAPALVSEFPKMSLA